MNGIAPRFASGQIIGARERQEDAVATLDLSDGLREQLLLVVADGMGGHRRAAEVAQLAVRRFCEAFANAKGPLAQRLRPALTSANDAIAMGSVRDAELGGAGCTLLSAAIEAGALSWISVGDSSLFLFRDGVLRKLNDDHSMRPVYSRLVAAGRLSAMTAARDPQRTSLRSALTGGTIRLVNNPPQPLALQPGDTIVLATDGLDSLGNRALRRVLRRSYGTRPSAAVERLFAQIAAIRAPDQDNTTIVICSILTRDGRFPRRRMAAAWAFGGWKFLGAVGLAAALLYAVIQWS